VYHVKLSPVLRDIFQRITLDELERVVRLRLDVHADNLIEASAVVAHRRAASYAE